MFNQVLQKLGFWTTVLSWREPPQYRVALKGDAWQRVLVAAGAGWMLMAVLLTLFAINVNPPHPGWSLIGFALGAAIPALVLFRGEATATGSVRVCQEGIIRKRSYTPILPVHLGFEEANWPYGSFSQAVIVPGHAIGKAFAVLLLNDGRDWDLIGVPSNINLQQLAQLLATRGVKVQAGSMVPEPYRRPLAWPIGAAVGGLGMLLLVVGIGFYAGQTGGDGEAVAAVELGHDEFFDAAGPNAPAPPSNFLPPAPPASPPPPGVAFEPSDPFPTSSLAPEPPQAPQPPPAKGTTTDDPFELVSAAAGDSTTAPASALIGGVGGFPFEVQSPREPVIGVRYATGEWGGKQALAELDPLFARSAAAGEMEAIAREGYVVGGLEVDASEFVHAVKVVFVRRQEDGRLNPADSYTSPWLGTPSGQPSQRITSGTAPVVGISGRRGAVIDAVGIVLGEQ